STVEIISVCGLFFEAVLHTFLERSSNPMGTNSQRVYCNSQFFCQTLPVIDFSPLFMLIVFQYQSAIFGRQLFETPVQALIINLRVINDRRRRETRVVSVSIQIWVRSG